MIFLKKKNVYEIKKNIILLLVGVNAFDLQSFIGHGLGYIIDGYIYKNINIVCLKTTGKGQLISFHQPKSDIIYELHNFTSIIIYLLKFFISIYLLNLLLLNHWLAEKWRLLHQIFLVYLRENCNFSDVTYHVLGFSSLTYQSLVIIQ